MNNKFWFFGSKLNTALLLVLIILMVIALRWMYQDKEKYLPNNQGPAETLQYGEDKETIEYNKKLNSTYLYTNHGFSIELPRGFVPVETQGEAGPGLHISLPGDSIVYYGDIKFWKNYILPSYKYVKDEKIGETIFKVYGYDDHSVLYWYERGNVGYELYGSKKSFETFKFVGWPEAQHYSKNGLSFEYSKDAKEKTLNGTFGPYHEIGIPGDNYYPDTLYFFKGEVPKDANMCLNVENKNMVINGKTFIYCDSKAEPYRTYIYKKDGKTVIVGTMLIGDEKIKTYIDLGSIEIE